MTPEIAAARAWLNADPDPETRAELEVLMASGGDELRARFAGRLQFGTAGLRGPLGAGPLRMNRVFVRQAAAGLVSYLIDTVPDARQRGVVIGFDARTNSEVFALDTARVCAVHGVRALLLPGPVPTPVAAFSIEHLGACAAVMVTASHNPSADNGYKVYLGDGAQIVPPTDAAIAAAIDAVGIEVTLAEPDHPLIERLGPEVSDAYVRRMPGIRLVPAATDVRVVYTPMHGVGRDTLLAAFAAAGFPTPVVVAEQADPDARFPTVPFPNPEEPGAMDLVLALAGRRDADLALANDPDADRLGVAVPSTRGGWRVLRGDEIGWLLADHILSHTSGSERLVVTTLVSSSLLSQMAGDYGVRYAETFTGFKWIARAMLDHPDARFVFGYEQALGYLVTDRPRDKDGISAAVLMAEVAALAKIDGVTLEERLAAIEARYGRHVIADRSLPIEPVAAAELVATLRRSPPASLAGEAVTEVTWFAQAGLLRLQCGPDLRVQVRPSGTEPKVKLYGEAIGRDPSPVLDDLAALATRLAP